MALFSQNTLTQVSGFDNPIIAGELVYNQKTYWNLALTSAGSPVNLTGATISASIVRRTISNLVDTRNGLTFSIGNYTPTPTAVALTIANLVAVSGTFTLVIDDSTWALVVGDPELDISATEPVAFSGRLKMSFPASGATPAEDNIIFLLFLVRSDGIINT
tara:strand:+ start:8477 stop:8959 length:483 start_codon:yes stop_codon:yes gene_type:complete